MEVTHSRSHCIRINQTSSDGSLVVSEVLTKMSKIIGEFFLRDLALMEFLTELCEVNVY